MKLKLLFCRRPCEENGEKQALNWEKNICKPYVQQRTNIQNT